MNWETKIDRALLEFKKKIVEVANRENLVFHQGKCAFAVIRGQNNFLVYYSMDGRVSEKSLLLEGALQEDIEYFTRFYSEIMSACSKMAELVKSDKTKTGCDPSLLEFERNNALLRFYQRLEIS